MKWVSLFFVIWINMSAVAQIERMEPPNWWVDFKDSNLQLLVKGKDIGSHQVSVLGRGVKLLKAHKANSSNYLFLDLDLTDAVAGNFQIKFEGPNGTIFTTDYELQLRIKPAEEYIGFDSSDVIYLITPDRFANGDPSNDIDEGMKETHIDRSDDYDRHGGDIRGIIEHLDYIDEMGFTAIWSCPLLINDMPSQSYHGYAITDFYQVDPRFGTLQEYQELSNKASQRGIKLIMDQVANHCGINHWWMADLPFSDWVNYQDEFKQKEELTTSSHRRTVNQDPYASEYDEAQMSQGWFVPSMPDLNQRNPFLANYITQNSLWWIETLNLGGIRQDTYPYPDKEFMSNWAKRIMTEYPNFNIVGEEWSYNPLLVGYWQQGANNKDGYESHLKTTMDFPLQQTIVHALNEDESWGSGLIKIYEGLANDFYYPYPQSILIFPDNHDMDRIFTQLNEGINKTKMAIALVLTLPRIPQIYYGTEILMQNTDKRGDHGLIRSDFPGGWEGDEVNAFTGKGLDEGQAEMQDFVKRLLNYRKGSLAMQKGKTVHFVPENGVYVYFRQHEDELVMCIVNKNETSVELDVDKFGEMQILNKPVKNVLTDKVFRIEEKLVLPELGFYLLTTKLDL